MFEDFIIDDEPNVTPRDITGTIGDVSCLNSLPDVPSFADAMFIFFRSCSVNAFIDQNYYRLPSLTHTESVSGVVAISFHDVY